ncbi:KaiC domain-containing protein [Salinibaculum rarum]|uniref:KaiC domain-containing protein n=1 Tax=Salinibaculum rarum TaxID=3058903 RepID=UPI00265F6B7B|nr:KaiC domain-containing protein [Salinibaculum sp. KK48]
MSEDQEDDDWFERALREGDDDSEDDADGTVDEAESESTDPFGDDTGDGDSGPFGGAADDGGDGGPFGDDTDAGSDGDRGPFGGETSDGDGSPFGDETGDDGDGPFGGGDDTGDDGDGPFGGGDDENLFDDDFGSAFESGGDEEFSDEELDSDIPRIDLGIEGLDNMIQGGVPERHLIVTVGSAGSGKTTFGLQFLYHGLQQGENAVFITLEQSHDSIIDTANEWGWEFDKYEAEDKLAVVDLDPVEMANSLDNIRAELPQLIKDFDADRLVLDSVSLLEMMYDDPAKRRTEVFDFTRSLKDAGVTTFLTSEASESNPYASRHGIIEYLTDAVFVLQYIRGEARETRLAVEIQKIRNANHSREMKPYEITNEGLSVYQQANIF